MEGKAFIGFQIFIVQGFAPGRSDHKGLSYELPG
jgi:hypothetical protein